MHKRAEIKAATKAILLNNTNAAANVFAARFVPLDEDELPGIAIYAGAETAARGDTMNEKRVLDLVVEILVSGYTADADLDAIAAQVERLMVQDDTMGGLTHEVALDRSEPGFDEESKTTLQALKMTFKVTYYVVAVADSPADALETVEVDHEDGAFQDHVDLEQ